MLGWFGSVGKFRIRECLVNTFCNSFPFGLPYKGQLDSKAECQAVDSPKKQMNEFAFFDLKSCYIVKSNAVRSFFWRI